MILFVTFGTSFPISRAVLGFFISTAVTVLGITTITTLAFIPDVA